MRSHGKTRNTCHSTSFAWSVGQNGSEKGRRDRLRRRLGIELLEDRRLLAAGDLDRSFDVDGKLTFSFGSAADSTRATDVKSVDGKIVAAGNLGSAFGVARFNDDGTFDSTFDGDGKATSPAFSNAVGEVYLATMKVAGDTKILAAGTTNLGVTVVRFNSDGSLDASFGGGDGIANTPVFDGPSHPVTGQPQKYNLNATSISVDSLGRIVVVGWAGDGWQSSSFLVARFTSNGDLDRSFSGDGVEFDTLSFKPGLTPSTRYIRIAFGVALDSQDRIVVVGGAEPENLPNFEQIQVTRYEVDGSRDATFGGSGNVALANFATGEDVVEARAIAIDADGKIIVAAISPRGFRLSRLTTNGTLDSSFGVVGNGNGHGNGDANGNGNVRYRAYDVPSNNAKDHRAFAMQLDSQGRIVVAGDVLQPFNINNARFALSRFNANGSLDMTFNGGVLKETEMAPGLFDGATALAIDQNGKLILAGQAYRNANSQFDAAIARYEGGAIVSYDYGDAPASYSTAGANAARHIATGPTLGLTRDAESDGQPSDNAYGDDLAGLDDEDGVSFTTIVPGLLSTATIAINGIAGNTPAYLSGWVDFNSDGDFEDANEQIIDGTVITSDGSYTQSFLVPATVLLYQTLFARFRISTSTNLATAGEAPDGEIEDYVLYSEPGIDYGDAPASYGTLTAGNKAIGPLLGTTRDFEQEAQPSVGADGDGADEDGVKQGSSLNNGPFNTIELASGFATFTVDMKIPPDASGNPVFANLIAWIDWGGDGRFTNGGERNEDNDRITLVPSIFSQDGSQTFNIPIPSFAKPGLTYARFRLSSDFSNDPSAYLQDGEIEDYAVTIVAPVTPTDILLDAFPGNLRPTISEHIPANSVLTTFSSVDADLNSSSGDSHFYALVPGIGDFHNSAFAIEGNELRLNASPNLQTQSLYALRVRTTDSYGLSFEKPFLITVNPNSPLSLNKWTLGNTKISTFGEEWVFRAEANTEATLELLNPNVPGGIIFRLLGDSGYDLNIGSVAEAKITFPTTGVYTLRVSSIDPPSGGYYAFRINQNTTENLELGISYTGNIPASGFSKLFKLDVSQARPLVIHFDGANALDRINVYARTGAIPTRADYNWANSTSGASHTVNIPLAPPGALYVLVYAESVANSSNYTLRIDEEIVAIDNVSPNQISASSTPATVIIKGLGFVPGTQVVLVPRAGGVTILPQAVSVDNTTQITASFNLAAAPIGDYDSRVTIAPGVFASLPAAVKIVAPEQGDLKTRLILPGELGRYAPATIYVEYSNEGTAAITSPILILKSADTNNSDGPLLTLNEELIPKVQFSDPPLNGYSSANGYLNSVQIYASGATPGLILPGESIRVPVYYAGLEQPYDLTDTTIELAIQVHSPGDLTALDWSSTGDFAKPDWIASDVWPLVRANLQLQIGNTWGDYVKTLRNNAEYLNRFGRSFIDVSELYGFEIRKALGLNIFGSLTSATDSQVATPSFSLSLSFSRLFGNTLSSRHQSGVFGQGWDASWQFRLEQLSDGTLIVHESADSQRRYQPDIRSIGAYISQEGDAGVMKAVAGGFELTDSLTTRYRGDGKLDYVKDTNNNRITPIYTGGQLTSLTHSAGGSLSILYNVAGRISSISDSTGRVTNYFYDATNTFLLSVSGPTGVTSYTYNPANGSTSEYALRTVTGPDGSTNHFDYDARGRIIASYLDSNVSRIEFDYSQNGQVKATDLTGRFNNSFFIASGLLVRREDSLGGYAGYQYDANRRLLGTSNHIGLGVYSVRNASGKPKSFADAFGRTVLSIGYGDPSKSPTSYTDANGNTTRYTNDEAGHVLSTLYPDGTVESATYDALGNLDVSTNRRGQTIDRTVNAAGQVTHEALSGGVTRDYVYDSRGRLHTAADSVSGTTTLDYDAADRLTKITYPNGRWLEYTYDLAGRRNRIEDQAGFATNYEYDASGQLIRLRDAANSVIIEYAYDLAGRLIRENKANGTYTIYDYDAVGRQSNITHYTSLGIVNSKFLYTFDAAGRRDTQTTIDGVWTYTYDLNDQLVRGVFVSTNPSIPNQDLEYEYDALGNRKGTVLNGVTAVYDANGMNQYTTAGGATFTYDLDGNLTQENGPGGLKNYVYNQLNQLVRVETAQGIWEYEYDILSNRSASIFNGARTEFLIDPIGLGNVVSEYQSIAGNTQKVGYAYGLGLEASFHSGSADYYDFDAIGSTAGLTDAAGNYVNQYAYDPWGESLLHLETIENSFEFVGQSGVINESNGLQFMRARYYSGVLGRFTSQDPLRLNAGDANFYRYVGNEPISRNDPSGLFVPGGFGGAGGLGGGGSGGGFGGAGGIIGLGGLAVGVAALSDNGGDVFAPPPPPVAGPDCIDNPACSGSFTVHSVPVPQPVPLPNPPARIAVNGVVGVVNSVDPNEKLAAAGFGPQAFIQDGAVIPYRINFENLGPGSVPTPAIPATAPAQRVEVTDQLTSNLDWSTFEFSEFGFGDRIESVPSGRTYFFKTIDIKSGSKSFSVEVELEFDINTGRLRAVFQSVDSATGLPPDVLTGFLPPEDGFGIGKAHVDFQIKPKANLASGTELRNIANIRFDYQTIIQTNQIDPQDPSQGTSSDREALNTIDASAPSSSITTLTGTSTTTTFAISWTGADDANGSGIAHYDVYVSDNGSLFVPWLTSTTSFTANFDGQDGHQYAFYSVAVDNVGLREPPPSSPDTLITVAENKNEWHNASASVDVNNDGIVSPIDALLIINDINSNGSRMLPTLNSTTNFLDVNNDHHVSPIDALLVINYINKKINGEGEDSSGQFPAIGLPLPNFANQLKTRDLLRPQNLYPTESPKPKLDSKNHNSTTYRLWNVDWYFRNYRSQETTVVDEEELFCYFDEILAGSR